MPGAKQRTSRAFSPDDIDSVWSAELVPEPPRQALAGSVQAHLAIVGGGLAGLSAAWHLRERFPTRVIVVLEAKAVGNGATGRSGGQALTGLHGAEPKNDDEIRRFDEVTRGGIDAIERWVRDLAIADAGFLRAGALEISTTEAGASAARARVERFNRAGVALSWLDGATVPMKGALGATFDPAGARLNPLALVRALRDELVRRGVAVHEDTPVVELDAGARRLVTPAGEVTAGGLVTATAAYSPGLRVFRGRLLPLHSHVVATAPIGPAQWAKARFGDFACFTDDRDRIAYGTRTPQGRLLFGGGDNEAYDYLFGGTPVWRRGRDREAAFGAVARRMRADFPAFAGVPLEHRWTGTVDLTLDRVCSIAADRALGFSGHGLALAALSGRVIADLHAGDFERWRGLPFLDRMPPRLPPEPLRWLGYQLYTRLTGRSPRRPA